MYLYNNLTFRKRLLRRLPGVLNKFSCGEAPSRGPTPYPFIYHFSRKRYPIIGSTPPPPGHRLCLVALRNRSKYECSSTRGPYFRLPFFFRTAEFFFFYSLSLGKLTSHQKKMNLNIVMSATSKGHHAPGGHLGIFWVGMCRPELQIGTPF